MNMLMFFPNSSIAPPPPTTGKIMLYSFGDSLDAGEGASNRATKSMVAQLAARLISDGYDVDFMNYGVGGSTADNLAVQIDQAIAHKNAQGTTYVQYIGIVGSGTNDTNQNVPLVDTCYDLLAAHRTLDAYEIASIDYTVTAFNIDEAGRTAVQRDVLRQDMNAQRKASWKNWFAKGIVDMGSDPIIGVLNMPFDPLYFTDGCHFTDVGYARKKDLILPAVLSILAGNEYGVVTPVQNNLTAGDGTTGIGPNLADPSIYVNSVGVVQAGEIIQETDPRWMYTGVWSTVNYYTYRQNSGKYGTGTGAIAGIKFFGTGFTYYFPAYMSTLFEIFVDGVSYGYAEKANAFYGMAKTITGLSNTEHTLVVRGYSGYDVIVDQLKIH